MAARAVIAAQHMSATVMTMSRTTCSACSVASSTRCSMRAFSSAKRAGISRPNALSRVNSNCISISPPPPAENDANHECCGYTGNRIAPDHALKFCGQAFAAFSSRSSDVGALIGEAGRYIAGRSHRFTAGFREEGCERILEAVQIPNKRIKVRPGRIHGLVGGAADRLFGPAERLHDGCARLGALCAEVGLFHASPMDRCYVTPAHGP